MQTDRYTQRSQGMLQNAQMLAVREGHQQLNPLHLLKVLVDDPDGLCATVLQNAGGSVSQLEQKIIDGLKKIPSVSGTGAGNIYMSQELAKALEAAEQKSTQMGDSFVSAEILLYGLTTISPTKELVESIGATPKAIDTAIQTLRQGRKVESQSAEESYDAAVVQKTIPY